MPRAIWKGAISFGLVHLPVSLYPASHENDIDFDWLDQRTLDPVGYKRVNKRTGKEIDKEHIVKGVRHDDGYVVLSDDEIRNAYPKTTQTIAIEAFVQAQDVSFVYLEKPYYLEPAPKAEKVYALLREAMAGASLIGIARVVMHNKEHLAALLPAGPALMLGTLRWADEIRSPEDLRLPPEGTAANGLKAPELQMARQLIDEMTVSFDASRYEDRFARAIRALVSKKAEAGGTQTVEPLEEGPPPGDNVVDLAELLKRSLGAKRGRTAEDAKAPPASRKPGKSARKRA
jgi:DNA end-binding protein Ku